MGGQPEGWPPLGLPDGRWRGCMTLPTGRPKYVSGKTRAEVAAKVAVLLATIAKGGLPVSSRQTTADWLTTWLDEEVAGLVAGPLRPTIGALSTTT